MRKELAHHRLDIKAFAQAGESRSGLDALPSYERLAQEVPQAGASEASTLAVRWSARGEARPQAGGGSQIWLHLHIQAVVPLICQRCMGSVMVPLDVDRAFRFVADEATAAALDDELEEDVLVLSREFDLTGLIEDELLMALPLVPRHDRCPTEVQLSVSDPEFEAGSTAKPHPFASLVHLRVGKSS